METSVEPAPPATLVVRERPAAKGIAFDVYERGRLRQNVVVTLVVATVPMLALVDRWHGGTVPWAVLAGSAVVVAWLVALWWQRDRVALDGDALRRGFWQLPTDQVIGFEVVEVEGPLGGTSWNVCVATSHDRRHVLFAFERAPHADYVAGRLRLQLAKLRPSGYRADGRRVVASRR